MKFVTLGPNGTCHENATRAYMRHFGIEDGEILLVEDFLLGLEMLHDGAADYLLQNSAHLQVNLVTEKYHEDISVIDTFIYPTQEMVVLEYADIEHPKAVGLVSATEGYLDGLEYTEKIYAPSKLRVAERLLQREFDAGLVYMYHHTENPGLFRMRRYIGTVITGWLVYGHERTYAGTLKSTLPQEYFRESATALHCERSQANDE